MACHFSKDTWFGAHAPGRLASSGNIIYTWTPQKTFLFGFHVFHAKTKNAAAPWHNFVVMLRCFRIVFCCLRVMFSGVLRAASNFQGRLEKNHRCRVQAYIYIYVCLFLGEGFFLKGLSQEPCRWEWSTPTIFRLDFGNGVAQHRAFLEHFINTRHRWKVCQPSLGSSAFFRSLRHRAYSW